MANKIKKIATEVANESKNVAVETTSINNSNFNEMVEEKTIATTVATSSETIAASESVNAAENTASINKSQVSMVKKEKVVITTKLAKINGEYVEITPAYSEYSMELPDYNEKLCKKMDHSKLFPHLFIFTDPEVFWKEGIQLYDRAGNPIEEGKPNVYVDCSSSESWRVWIDEKLERVEVLEYNSVQEFAQAVGTSNLYSRGLNNTEKIGVAALATGNEAYKTVFSFAKKHELTSTAANLYLDVKMTKLQIMKMSTGVELKAKPELGRSVEEAEILLSQVKKTFGKENARKRYVISAINMLKNQKNYAFETIVNAVQELTETELAEFKATPSDIRVATISVTLADHIKDSVPMEIIVKEAV